MFVMEGNRWDDKVYHVVYQASHSSPLQFTLGNILDLLIFIHFEDITDRVDVSAVINAMRCFKLITVFKYTRYYNTNS